MSDDTPMSETLDSIAGKISELAKRFDAVETRFDARFAQVEARFDGVEQRIAETRSQLGVKIEAVHAEVKLVYDVVIAQQEKNKANDKEHGEFREQLTDHDLRLRALGSHKGGGRNRRRV